MYDDWVNDFEDGKMQLCEFKRLPPIYTGVHWSKPHGYNTEADRIHPRFCRAHFFSFFFGGVGGTYNAPEMRQWPRHDAC